MQTGQLPWWTLIEVSARLSIYYVTRSTNYTGVLYEWSNDEAAVFYRMTSLVVTLADSFPVNYWGD